MAPRGRGTSRAGRGLTTDTPPGSASRGLSFDTSGPSSTGSIGVSTPMDHLRIGETPSTDMPMVCQAPKIGSRGPDGRILAGIQSGVLMPSGKVSTCTCKSFQKKVHPDGITWKGVPQSTRDDYFDDIKKEFYWPSAQDGVIRAAWEAKAKERYADFIYRIKKDRLKKRPAYVPESAWPTWLAHWEKDEVKAKAETNKKNRMSEPDGPGTGIVKHKGGSRSVVEHAAILLAEGVPPELLGWEVFKNYHEGGGTFSDQKSARIHAEVLARAELESSPLPGEYGPRPIDMDAILNDVVGGVSRKKRVFGQGARSNAYSSIGSSEAPSSQMDSEAFSQRVDQLVDERVSERVDQLVDERVAERVSVFQEEQQRSKEKITDLESRLMEMREEQKRMMEMFMRGGGHGSSSGAGSAS